MSDNTPLELISFALCPFVQRSAIALLEKQAPFTTTYIDLQNPPPWFLGISPFGKVPVLRVADTVLFESAVINEYLDETHPPSMHPADPLLRARNRAWIEFGSDLLFTHYRLYTAADEAAFEKEQSALTAKLARLETQLGDGPFFNGPQLSLLDAAYAPLFQRIDILERHRPLGLIETPRVQRWSDALLARESVRKSVRDSFEDDFLSYLTAKDGYAAQWYREAG
ncbi:MAG: glutathione S-transferase family protein [Gammaproteobacteria bacterium]